MRVALLADRFTPDPGGLSVAAARIARQLVEVGAAVETFALGDDLPPGAQRLDELGDCVPVWRLGPARDPEETQALLFERLAARHDEAPFDVIHGLYLVRSGFLAAYAGRYLDVPSVVSARGNDLDRAIHDPGRAAHVLRALDLASAVTAVSAELARKARALSPQARVEVVPNGVDTWVFHPVPHDEQLHATLELAGRAVIGFAGELRHKKGLTTLLPALAKLAEKRPVTLLAAGGVRSDAAGYVELFQRRHPEVRLALLPQRSGPELPPVYALMDVFVHPSLRDGMPNALLEAMACGRPVVGASAGGIPDVLGDGGCGLLVPPGDVDALVAAIESLLDDRPRAEALANAARERVAREFTPEREAKRYLSLFRELAAAPRTGRTAAAGPATR
ncbi:MAG: glycosyltransferase family 4 protein [Vicinamibacteria bacterium]|nr:glycosyltransferase family 4 protein [Vicinamibacteria bacterium]